jgi:hypothetical protein
VNGWRGSFREPGNDVRAAGVVVTPVQEVDGPVPLRAPTSRAPSSPALWQEYQREAMMILATLDRLVLARFRRIYARHTGQRSALGGHNGLMEQVRQELVSRSPDAVLHVEAAVLSDFLGPADRLVRHLTHRWPRASARIVALLLRTAFRSVVGPMRSGGDGVIEIPHCTFLAGGGRDACVFVCQKPTERYLHSRFGLRTKMYPDFATGCCRVVVDTR